MRQLAPLGSREQLERRNPDRRPPPVRPSVGRTARRRMAVRTRRWPAQPGSPSRRFPNARHRRPHTPEPLRLTPSEGW